MTDLPRRLGLREAIALVAGTIIGSGIFLAPNLVAKQVPSAPAMLAVWIFSGLLSLCGALVYAELGAMLPSSGGQYTYLREAFGPLAAFLCGWTYFLVIMTAAIAWLGTAFSIYLSTFLPLSAAAQKAVAVACILALSVVNYRGVQFGAAVQDVLALIKTAGILLLIGAALLSPVNQWSAGGGGGEIGLAQFGLAMVACLLTYDGWIALSLVAGEVKDPKRNLPLGLIGGLAICIALYVMANVAYLKLLTVEQVAGSQRVAAEALTVALGGSAGKLIALLILLSIAGSVNGWLLAAPRVYFAQAQDGLFFRQFAEVHPRYLTPGFSILAQGVWASMLCLTGTYETLGSFAMFAAWLFYGATAIGAMVLRKKRPDLTRPYRMPAYPLLPLVFTIVALVFVGNLFATDPGPAFSGTAIIAAGVPAYWIWKRFTR